MHWRELFTALALVLVIEGVFPFLNPGGLRRALAVINQLSDRQIRYVGLACMTAGLVALSLIR